ncbi:MAG TPA: DUF2079 domain-containing protein [Candidatus Binatia bacterium]|nr:DUF2079 domain-containing protein [Candidatus Binatia bacterium]
MSPPAAMMLMRVVHGNRKVATSALAVLFSGLYAAGYFWLQNDDLWVFQGIMGFTAAGLLLAFAIGRTISLRACEALERWDRWLTERPARASILLGSFVCGYLALWCGVSFLRHYYFHSSYDLGILHQVVWNTSQGRPFLRSIEVANDFGDHIRPYLGLLSLVYLLVPSPYVLLTFQSLVLALSAWPLYRLARRKFDSPGIALATALCLLAYPPMGFLNRYDFHVEVLSIPLLIAAYERIDIGDLKNASIFMAVTLFCKENLGLTVAALGITAGLSYKHRLFGLTWAVIGATYSAIALFAVISAIRGEPSDTLARYHWLGDTPSRVLWAVLSQPNAVLQKVFAVEHILTLLQLMAPFAFLPLLGLSALIPAVPTALYNFLAEWPAQTTIYYHYMAPLVPFVAIAAVIGLHRLKTNPQTASVHEATESVRVYGHRTFVLGACAMLMATAASWIYQNPVTANASLLLGARPQLVPMGSKTPLPLVWPNDAAIREGLRSVPRDLPLLTTAHYAPHLSHRVWIEMIPRSPVPGLPPQAEIIFLNLKDLRSWTCRDYLETLEAAACGQFGVIFYRDNVIVVQRNHGSKTQLLNLLRNWQHCDDIAIP